MYLAEDSFENGMLDYPHYTRPEVYLDPISGALYPVPPILLSGHHREVGLWRHQQALKRTQELRPDLLPGKKINRDICPEDKLNI